MSLFVTEIRVATAMDKTDINKISENILIPLFAEIYDFKNLKNLNFTEGSNFPGIDLGDEIAKVAFQITATPNLDKIKHTLNKFIENELYKNYDRLIIYILVEKQKTYSTKAIEEIIKGKFQFNIQYDIIDYLDIIRLINQFPIDKAYKIENILKLNFGTDNIYTNNQSNSPKKLDPEIEKTLNLFLTKCSEDDEFAELDQAGETDPERRTLLEQIFIDLNIKIKNEKPSDLVLENLPEPVIKAFLDLEEVDDIPF
jgi:hypothetical protein